VYDAENGRWTRRDPLGYVDGMGLYEYCRSGLKERRDPKGLAAIPDLQDRPGMSPPEPIRPRKFNFDLQRPETAPGDCGIVVPFDGAPFGHKWIEWPDSDGSTCHGVGFYSGCGPDCTEPGLSGPGLWYAPEMYQEDPNSPGLTTYCIPLCDPYTQEFIPVKVISTTMCRKPRGGKEVPNHMIFDNAGTLFENGI